MTPSPAPIKRIAISTGGGDAPGLNAVIRAATLAAINRGWECYGIRDVMVALDPPTVKYVPLEKATRRMKTVPPDCDTIMTARDLGVCFGD